MLRHHGDVPALLIPSLRLCIVSGTGSCSRRSERLAASIIDFVLSNPQIHGSRVQTFVAEGVLNGFESRSAPPHLYSTGMFERVRKPLVLTRHE
jgi:hypothetical protein